MVDCDVYTMMRNRTPKSAVRSGIQRRLFGRTSGRVVRGRRRMDERGSSLILALVYIVAISLIVGALADWAMNDLTNTNHFQSANSTDNAISGATEVAIQSVRYYPYYNVGVNNSPNYGNCWSPPSGYYASEVPF